MHSLLLGRITVVWAALVAATMLSWGLGHGSGPSTSTMAGAVILVVSVLKVRYVILDFMEVRHAPRFMRLVAEGWCGLLGIVLVALLLWGAPY